MRRDAAAGPVAMEPPSERFHWLTAPRSDVLQTSPIHEGLSDDPARALEALYQTYVMEGLTPGDPAFHIDYRERTVQRRGDVGLPVDGVSARGLRRHVGATGYYPTPYLLPQVDIL